MIAPSGVASAPDPVATGGVSTELPAGEAELRRRYVAYRRQQARELLTVVPRDGVRSLYRQAVRSGSVPTADASVHSLEALLVACEAMLPLPPYEVWVEDLRRHPAAHVAALGASPEAPTSAAPVTLADRAFQVRGVDWRAELVAFRDGDAWRGFIDFAAASGPVPHRRSRTALIFREGGPADLRESFMDFTSEALAAFLRSTLP